MVLLIVIKLLSENSDIFFFLEYAKDLCIFVIKVVCLIQTI